MHRIATFFDPDAAALAPKVDSEWVLRHHLKVNNIEVRCSTRCCPINTTASPYTTAPTPFFAVCRGFGVLGLQQVIPITFPLTRVRLTGDIPTHDQHIVEEVCLSGEDAVACDIAKCDFTFPCRGGGGA